MQLVSVGGSKARMAKITYIDFVGEICLLKNGPFVLRLVVGKYGEVTVVVEEVALGVLRLESPRLNME